MNFDKEIVDGMSPDELESTLKALMREKAHPHLAAFIAYVLTYHYYYHVSDADNKARKYYDIVLALLNDPPGYGWCFIGPHMLCGIICPHYLHGEVVKQNFSRLAKK